MLKWKLIDNYINHYGMEMNYNISLLIILHSATDNNNYKDNNNFLEPDLNDFFTNQNIKIKKNKNKINVSIF